MLGLCCYLTSNFNRDKTPTLCCLVFHQIDQSDESAVFSQSRFPFLDERQNLCEFHGRIVRAVWHHGIQQLQNFLRILERQRFVIAKCFAESVKRVTSLLYRYQKTPDSSEY